METADQLGQQNVLLLAEKQHLQQEIALRDAKLAALDKLATVLERQLDNKNKAVPNSLPLQSFGTSLFEEDPKEVGAIRRAYEKVEAGDI